jgi:predicted PhzF superfamily epimerase YddE/YHI9
MDVLVVLGSEHEVRELTPIFDQFSGSARGVIVTAAADDPAGEYQFVSRFFAPQSGVNEDPVTGSAHCCLGPYWGRHFGRDELVGYQASKRGGLVRVRLAGDRVFLGGRAVTVAHGELLA